MPMVLERPKRADVPRGGRGASRRQRDFSPALFWVLLGAGMAVLGACMVVPVWRNCQVLAGQSRALSERVVEHRLRALADQEAIEAAQNSVAFNERLLIEELNYQRPGEQILPASYVQKAQAQQPVAEQGAFGPPWLGAFVQRDTRSILLVMSGGLVLFAFVYYPAGARSVGAKKVPRIPVHSMGARFIGPTQSHQSSLYKT